MRKVIIGSGILIVVALGGLVKLRSSQPADWAQRPQPVSNKTEDDEQNNPSPESQSEIKPENPETENQPPGQDASAVIKEKKQEDYVVDESGKHYPLRSYKTLALPNDPSAAQWWVSNTGIDSLWDMGAGSYTPTIAVIDTGFALKHQEFNSRLYTNSGESGATSSENPSLLNCTDQSLTLDESCNVIDDDFDGIIDNESGSTTYQNSSLINCTDQGVTLDKSCNLVDDDGNGLIDDAHGFDFVNFDRSSQAGETNPSGAGTTHGTAVMGIAAATGNNGVGIAGANWNGKLLPLQALDDDEYGNTISVGRAIRYAADQGADVISISLGTSLPDDFVRNAVAYAISKGSIVVAAAGNDGCDCMLYPAQYNEVLAVGASDQNDEPTWFSSYGTALDVLAPGISMTSAYWTASNGTSSYASGLAGTSFATPLVSGMLATLKSQQPTASTQQLTALLTEQTNRIALGANQNHSSTLGYGRVDASLLASRLSTPKNPALRYMFGPLSYGNKLGSYEVTGSTKVYQCEGNRPGTTTIYRLNKGVQTLYTTSLVEQYKAVEDGYSSNVLGSNFCTNLPADQPQQIRMISIAGEFENNSPVKF